MGIENMSENQHQRDEFIQDLRMLDIALSDLQLDQMTQYYETLMEWNEKMNLTAITEYGDVMKKHFIDSISIVKACNMDDFHSMIDVGTGAGFPGLVLKIVFPGLHVTLMDSLHKRIQFLNHLIQFTEERKIVQRWSSSEKSMIYVSPGLWLIFPLSLNTAFLL